MYVTLVCLTFNERLSYHCNIGGFIIAQEELNSLWLWRNNDEHSKINILTLNDHIKSALFFRNTAAFKAFSLWENQILLCWSCQKNRFKFLYFKKKKKVVRIKQAIERDAHFWECPGSFIITERMACMIRHWALADSVGCDHTYKLTDTVPPTPFCQ